MEKERTRKTRKDKKKEVKPSLLIEFKECLYRVAYITQTPVKDVAVILCDRAFNSSEVMSNLSTHLRRAIRIKNTMYMGDLDRPSLRTRSLPGTTDTITMKFDQNSYENICTLAYGLDVTPTRATALLLHASVHQSDILNDYIQEHIKGQLSVPRMKELRKVLEYINNHNSQEAEVSWITFLSYLYEDIKSGEISVSESIQEFLGRWKSIK